MFVHLHILGLEKDYRIEWYGGRIEIQLQHETYKKIMWIFTSYFGSRAARAGLLGNNMDSRASQLDITSWGF
jgi:hypothetical protein